MRKVISYGSIDGLRSSSIYGEICDCIQFSESMQMAKSIMALGLFQSCHVFVDLMRCIDPYWSSEKQRSRCFALMSKFIRSKMVDGHGDKEWLTGCSRRLQQLWSGVNLLEEADVRPEDIVSDDRGVKLLVDVWRYLVEKEQGFRSFREHMGPEYAIPAIRRKIEGWKKAIGSTSNVIVIHGFYFITPIQERVIRLLYESGYDVYFLIPYRPEYPFAHKVWTDLYNNENGYGSIEEWIHVQGGKTNKFGEMLEGRDITDLDCKMKEYKNVMAFVNDLHDAPEDLALYSPDPKTANDILQDFFPERYGKRRLFSYPVGGFIQALHSMWDDESQTLRIDPNKLIDCLASGWISYKGIRSDVVLKDLERIMPFFKECLTVKDWEDRAMHLFNIHEDVISRFRSHTEDDEIRRWENILDNPFSNFSIFDVPRERIELILGMIMKLLECAQNLFEGGVMRGMGEHIDKIMRILDDNKATNQDDEYSIAKAFLDRIRGNDDSDKYNPSDLVNAIMTFLSNEVQSDGSDQTAGWVQPLFDIEGSSSDVHICMSSQENLPGKQRDYVWPLNKEVIGSIESIQQSCDRYPLIRNVMFITNTNPEANRFLLFDAFDRGEVTMSWISDDGRLHAPSPYMTLMSKLSCQKIEVHGKGQDIGVGVEDTEEGSNLLSPMRVTSEIPEVVYDVGICPRRYLYGYYLRENPSFSSDFHFDFAIGGLLTAIEGLYAGSDRTCEEIEDNVFDLFPFLLDVEKRNIVDRNAGPRFTGFSRYNNVMYTDYRLGIHFPPPLWNGMVDMKIDLTQAIDIISALPSEMSCMYCPHSSLCPKSKFKGDDRAN